ncbi:MAG: TetR/AcrR family transcriptional regulator [Tissierellia bacterium]|nr:TetR/AcrR family transcriptional regulator [Tissierellia bacterium]
MDKQKVYKCTEETRTKLIETITKLFRKEGFSNITVRQICQAANVSSGSFYHHFQSKENLALVAYERVEKLLTEQQLPAANALSPLEGLHAMMVLPVKVAMKEGRQVMQEYYTLILKKVFPPELSSERPFFSGLESQLLRLQKEGLLREHLSTRQLAFHCMRHIRGLIFHWTIDEKERELLPIFERDFQVLIHGILK